MQVSERTQFLRLLQTEGTHSLQKIYFLEIKAVLGCARLVLW